MAEHITDLTDRWFVIVNPVAGSGKGLIDFPQISRLLRNNDICHDAVFTEHKYHATELAVSAANQGYRRIIVVGGDGTMNEAVNGLFIQKAVEPHRILLAVIAVGTGNDWVRTFGIPFHYSEAIRAIREERSFLQDVGTITYTESRYTQTRYMANVAGVGFDAFVVSTFNHLKNKGHKGRWLYLFSILHSYFRYKSAGVKISVDGTVIFNDLMFSLAIGICKFNGGGVQQLPNALADDGLLDLTIIKPIHWWHIIFRLQKLFNGDIYEIGHVIHAQGRNVRIEASPLLNLETDGELFGETPVEINVVPRSIRVVVTKEFLGEN